MPVEPALIVGVWHRRVDRHPFHAWMRAQIFGLLKPLDEGEAASGGTPGR